MKLKKLAAISLALFVPTMASAHRSWMLPSATVLSGEKPWVTVDASVGNELFYFDHRPMGLNDLVVSAPDGSKIEPQHVTTGHYRSTFDVELAQPGTYRLSVGSASISGVYMLNGERQRWRGTAAEIKAGIPKEATEVNISESFRRVDTFVTAGAPTETTVKPTGKGLEVAFDTHPNDLFAGEIAKFRLLMNGKPAAGVEVSVIPGGNRYRDELNEIKLTTAKDGSFEVKWPQAGMYWLNAEYEDDKPSAKEAKKRTATYTATLEVLPQ